MGQLSEVGCVVACADSSLRVYRKSQLVSKVMLPCPAQAMVYGRFGREDAALVLALANGALHVKFLPRANALFNGSVYTHDTSHQALEIPKKTKVFVELTQRERESAVEMHRLFQRDLTKLRLKAAKTFIQLLTDGQGHVSYGKGANLRMNTTVMGLGPTFCVQLSLQNTGEDMIADLILVVLANKARYRVEPGMMPIPVLCPGALHPFEVKCVALTLDAPPEDVQVLVLREGHPTPLLAVAAKMPASEPWDEE
jgi:Bardet-Biedl syndrome 1 protein